MKVASARLLLIVLGLVLSQTLVSHAVGQPSGQSVISFEYRANLPYKYRIWDSAPVNVSMTIQLWILQPVDNVTLSFSVPTPSGLTSQVPPNSTYRVMYDAGMKPTLQLVVPGVDLQALPTTVIISYESTVRYVLGLAYFSAYPNPLSVIDVKGVSGFILSTRLTLNLPSYLVLTQGSPFPAPSENSGGTIVYQGDLSRQDPVVLYQSSTSILISAAGAILLLLVPLAFRSLNRKGRVAITGQTHQSLREVTARVREVARVLRKTMRTDSVKTAMLCLLAASSLSLSLAFAVGPNPRVHAMIFSDLSNSASVLARVQSEYPQVDAAVYSWWGGTGLRNELVSFQVIDLLIILDPPVTQLSVTSINQFASSGTHLVVIDSFQNSTFAKLAASLYQASGQLRVFGIDGLTPLLDRIALDKSSSPRLFSPSIQLWEYTVAVISVLSILLVFFAALLSVSVITQAGPPLHFGKVLRTIAWLLGSFTWVLIVYYVVSFVLRVPLTLHAAPPDFPKSFAATGSLGLGGGSIPRMLGGGVGALIAVLISHMQRKAVLNWILLLPFAATALLAGLLPVTGPFVDQVLLFGIQGEITPTMTPVVRLDNLFSSSTALYFALFSIPDISRGIFLYFLAGTAFLSCAILSRNLRTLVVLAAIPLFGRGMARVGDLDIFTFLGTLSGAVVASIILVMVFLAVSRLKSARGNIAPSSAISETSQSVSQSNYQNDISTYHVDQAAKDRYSLRASTDSN